MRSLKYLISKKKPLVDVNTDFLTVTNPNININTLSIRNDLTPLRIVGIPNTPIGLQDGGVWRDDNGFLRIV